MAFDQHANFAYSTVLTAPSPATSGTSVVLQSGDGALFPAAPFNVAIWPAGAQPLASTAEIARCTAKASDTLTITRAQEGTSPRSVVVGDQIAAVLTAKSLTDIEALAFGANVFAPLADYIAGNWYGSAVTGSQAGTGNPALALNQLFFLPFVPRSTHTFVKIGIHVTTAAASTGTCRLGVYGSTAAFVPNVTAGPLFDSGSLATTSIADVTATMSLALTVGQLYYLAVVAQTTVTNLAVTQITHTNMPSLAGSSTLSAGGISDVFTLTGVSGALPSTGSPTSSEVLSVPAVCVQA